MSLQQQALPSAAWLLIRGWWGEGGTDKRWAMVQTSGISHNMRTVNEKTVDLEGKHDEHCFLS